MIKFVNNALELVCADDNDVQVKNTRKDNEEEKIINTFQLP